MPQRAAGLVFSINIVHIYSMKAPCIHIAILVAFLTNTFGSVPLAQAQDFRLPAPGVMVHLSPPLDPPILKGIKVHPDNPFRFDFILDKGDSVKRPYGGDIVSTGVIARSEATKQSQQEQLKTEAIKLIKYFLASLTIPEKDLWVNLSPYEKDRIIPNSFGLTEMGRDLLAEDYMLKQITASLIYPEDKIGKKFWKRIYEEATKRYGTTNIPVNTFNKVWIVPEKAVVYENAKAGTAYVVESKLKVMLEQDYLSLEKHEGIQSKQAQTKNTSQLGSQIVREIVIPQLTIEINENKNFAHLRQVYNSLILATWYKKKIKDSILEQVYADKNKVAGVNIDDPKEKERIYQKYLRAFKKGVFNYIKEDVDPTTQETIPRKYFSGGMLITPKITTATDSQAMAAIQQEEGLADHVMQVEATVGVAQVFPWHHQVTQQAAKGVPSAKPSIIDIVKNIFQRTADTGKQINKIQVALGKDRRNSHNLVTQRFIKRLSPLYEQSYVENSLEFKSYFKSLVTLQKIAPDLVQLMIIKGISISLSQKMVDAIESVPSERETAISVINFGLGNNIDPWKLLNEIIVTKSPKELFGILTWASQGGLNIQTVFAYYQKSPLGLQIVKRLFSHEDVDRVFDSIADVANSDSLQTEEALNDGVLPEQLKQYFNLRKYFDKRVTLDIIKNMVRDAQANGWQTARSSPQKISNLQLTKEGLAVTDMLLVHKTDYPPENGQIRATMNAIGRTVRDTIHFSLNHQVGSHAQGDWDDKLYTVLIPLYRVPQEQVENILPVDTWLVGDVTLPEGSIVLGLKGAPKPANLGNAIYLEIEKNSTSIEKVSKDLGYEYIEGFDKSWYGVSYDTVDTFRKTEGILYSKEHTHTWRKAYEKLLLEHIDMIINTKIESVISVVGGGTWRTQNKGEQPDIKALIESELYKKLKGIKSFYNGDGYTPENQAPVAYKEKAKSYAERLFHYAGIEAPDIMSIQDGELMLIAKDLAVKFLRKWIESNFLRDKSLERPMNEFEEYIRRYNADYNNNINKEYLREMEAQLIKFYGDSAQLTADAAMSQESPLGLDDIFNAVKNNYRFSDVSQPSRQFDVFYVNKLNIVLKRPIEKKSVSAMRDLHRSITLAQERLGGLVADFVVADGWEVIQERMRPLDEVLEQKLEGDGKNREKDIQKLLAQSFEINKEMMRRGVVNWDLKLSSFGVKGGKVFLTDIGGLNPIDDTKDNWKMYGFLYTDVSHFMAKRLEREAALQGFESQGAIERLIKSMGALEDAGRNAKPVDETNLITRLSKQIRKDLAMEGSPTGGIDLTPAEKVLQSQNAGEGIKFHLDSAQLAQFQNAPGLVPVIIDIQPMRDLRKFLGMQETVGQEI